MHSTALFRLAAGSLLVALLAGTAAAQDPPFNTTLVSNWDGVGSGYADVWGDGNFIYQARYNFNEVEIVDISDPSNPQLASTVVVGGANAECSAQDVKVGDGLLFIALEYDQPDGVLICDVRDPYNPVQLTLVDPEPGNFEEIHNLFYDNGWLYMSNSTDTTIAIVDLRTYDPDNAPPSIGTYAYKLTNLGGMFVHDMTVQNGRLYISAWDTLWIYDVSNLGQQAPQQIGVTYGSCCHAVWPSADGQYLVTGEERKGGAVRLYEVIDNGSSLDLIQRDSVTLDLGESFSAHNPIILGDRVYSSWYQAGALVLEIDRSSKTLERVAQYDTNGAVPFGYGGDWGVYPFLGEDKVLLSDLANGSYVIDMSALQVDLPVLPTTMSSSTPYTLTFDVKALGNAVLDPGNVSVLTSVGGAPFQSQPATYLGGSQFQATLPSAGCDAEVRYYVSATDTQGRTFTDPAMAPTDTHVAWSADSLTPVFSDDFETDQGWTVDGDATTGLFVRVDPVGTSAQPEDDDPDGTGTMCYVTGQGNPGDPANYSDVDNGYTSLTSPIFDMSTGDGLVRWSSFFFNGKADEDFLKTEISNDAGATWTTIENQLLGGGGWRHSVHRVSDYVAPTAQMMVRFTVEDLEDEPTTTNAAIDEFHVDAFTCNTNASATPRNGSGLNPECLATSSLPVLGTLWTASVDGSALPGASLSYLVSYAGATQGTFLNAGELLVDVTAPFVFATTAAPDASGTAVHSIPWPNDPSLIGLSASAQGVLVGGGVQLCNALDLVLDQ